MTDAMLAYRQDANPGIAFALINAGGIRATIDVGPITRGEVLTSFPFGNSIVELTFSGADLWKAVEGILTGVSQFNQREVTSFFQVSKGVEISYNPTNPNNTRLISFHINDEPLDMEKEYQFVTLDFLAGGGDNFWETQSDFVTLDTQDEVLVQYIEQTSPVSIEIEGRIKITEETVPGNGEGGGEGPTVPPPGNGTNTTNPPPVPGPGEGESTASVLSASSALGAVVIAAVVGVFGWAL